MGEASAALEAAVSGVAEVDSAAGPEVFLAEEVLVGAGLAEANEGDSAAVEDLAAKVREASAVRAASEEGVHAPVAGLEENRAAPAAVKGSEAVVAARDLAEAKVALGVPKVSVKAEASAGMRTEVAREDLEGAHRDLTAARVSIAAGSPKARPGEAS